MRDGKFFLSFYDRLKSELEVEMGVIWDKKKGNPEMLEPAIS